MTSTFSSFLGYSRISDKAKCYLITGGLPSSCQNHYVYSSSTCKSSCTSLESCIGFSYSTAFNWCSLHPSSETCPYGFDYYVGTNRANTRNDLVAGESWTSTYDCYRKFCHSNEKNAYFSYNMLAGIQLRWEERLWLWQSCRILATSNPPPS